MPVAVATKEVVGLVQIPNKVTKPKKAKPKKTAQSVFKEALRIIKHPGWWRVGTYCKVGTDGKASYCAVGAILAADGFSDKDLVAAESEMPSSVSKSALAVVRALNEILEERGERDTLPGETPEPYEPGDIYDANDHGTQASTVQLFKDAGKAKGWL